MSKMKSYGVVVITPPINNSEFLVELGSTSQSIITFLLQYLWPSVSHIWFLSFYFEVNIDEVKVIGNDVKKCQYPLLSFPE